MLRDRTPRSRRSVGAAARSSHDCINTGPSCRLQVPHDEAQHRTRIDPQGGKLTFAASAGMHLTKGESGHSAKCLSFKLKWEVPLSKVVLEE